jgi:hypothetical protein
MHCRVVKETHYYVHAVHSFQIMIPNGSMMKHGGNCENVKLQMEYYLLNCNMFDIEMDGCDAALGAKWLADLGLLTMGFKELYMIFNKEGRKHTLKDIQPDSP